MNRRTRDRADALVGAIVRARGECEACGTNDLFSSASQSTRLECAHILSRRYAATRTWEPNLVCLCSPCHRRFTLHPLDWETWCLNRLGEDGYAALRARAQSRERFDWEAELERLR